jgi:hypothetical protein
MTTNLPQLVHTVSKIVNLIYYQMIFAIFSNFCFGLSSLSSFYSNLPPMSFLWIPGFQNLKKFQDSETQVYSDLVTKRTLEEEKNYNIKISSSSLEKSTLSDGTTTTKQPIENENVETAVKKSSRSRAAPYINF